MNGYELIELLDKNSGEGNTPVRQALTMLRQKADRIAELEKQIAVILEANERSRP